MTAALAELVRYLDARLEIPAFPDYAEALNGLQLENRGDASRIAAAVDASQATITAVREAGADFLLVHHGLFWGGAAPLTDRRFRKLHDLIDGNVAVYGAHLPLDAHAEVGNNVLLLRALDIEPDGQFGDFQGSPIGWWGRTDLSRAALAAAIQTTVNPDTRLLPFGPDRVRRVGVVTGAGGSLVEDAKASGLDTFITGEAPHHTYFDAQELGLNVFHAGHYATETFGVKAVAAELSARFSLPWTFIDLPTGT